MTKENTNKSYTHEYDITKFYTRVRQDSHGTNYIITPTDTCPLEVLNQSDRFVVLTFDRSDDYIVVAGYRYYLNKYNSVKATNHLACRDRH